MPSDLPVSCTCGALQGRLRQISASRGNHAVCYCDDCQAFAHFLGRAPEILDARGGTQIFQMSPARLVIESGTANLACMRLTPRGLMRWYTSCCHTPIGNTLPTSKVPFVGLIHLCIRKQLADPSLDAAVGPVRRTAFRQFAKGDPATTPSGVDSLPYMMLRLATLMVRWKLKGDQRRSPFFEPRTGQPVAVPRVLSETERDELRHKVNAKSIE